MLEQNCQEECPADCASPFSHVVVSYLQAGGTRVLWKLDKPFAAMPPLQFTLQYNENSNKYADWVDVGQPVNDIYTAVDTVKRNFGMINRSFYRVKLVAGGTTYYSEPVGTMGTLSRRDWGLAREILRKQTLAFRGAAQYGYLLKQRISGRRCLRCTDAMTSGIKTSNCIECYGTGFTCGYYYPMDCVWASLSPRSYREQLDDANTRGTVDDITVSAKMIVTPLMEDGDVWVSRNTDLRYFVRIVKETANWRGVPLLADVELRQIPFTSRIYGIQIPQQLRFVNA